MVEPHTGLDLQWSLTVLGGDATALIDGRFGHPVGYSCPSDENSPSVNLVEEQ